MSIKSKLILLFVVFTLVPTAFVATYGYRMAEDSLRRTVRTHLEGVAILKAKEISRFFEQTRIDLITVQDSHNLKSSIATLIRLRGQKTDSRYREAVESLDSQFKRFTKNHGLHDIDVVGLDGKLIYGTYEDHSDNKAFPDAEVFRHALKGTYFSDLYRSKDKERHFLLYAVAPLNDMNGKPLSVIVFEVIADNFFTTIQDTTGLGQTGETLIGKKIGDRVLFLNPLRHDQQAALSRSAKIGGNLAVPVLRAATGQNGSGVELDYRGTEVIAAWRHIPEVDWGMVAKIDTSEAFAPINQLRLETIITCGVILLLGIGIAFVTAKSITVPINELEKGTQIFGGGNLDHRVEVKFDDEIGTLAKAFNRMAENLKETTASRDELREEVEMREKLEQAMVERLNELNKLNGELDKLNGELDDFTYVASHDLQEPVRKLLAFSDLLRKDLGDILPPRAEKDLEFIVHAARRMQQLVRDLLALSRAGNAPMVRKELALDDVIVWALDALGLRLAESGATIIRDPLPTVWGDLTLLTQLYQNLIGNALKYTDGRHPEISLTAEQIDGEWVLGVRDNGIGIDPKYKDHIFQPFKRLHGQRQYEGSGVGLSICRKVVERHGGRIWVESEEGKGAHFRFTLGKNS